MYYHKITEYEIKCCMHAHHGAPRAPSSRGELYRHKTLFLDDFPIFFYYPNGTWTHPPTSKLFLDFWNFFNFAKPLTRSTHSESQTMSASITSFHGLIVDTIRYDTIRYDTIRYDTIRYDTIRYDTIRYDTIRYDTISPILHRIHTIVPL